MRAANLVLERGGARDSIVELTAELSLSQDTHLNDPMSAMIRARLIEVGACLGNDFNVFMAAAGQVEGAHLRYDRA